jgi:hypothetical protein
MSRYSVWICVVALLWAAPAWSQPRYEETRVGTRFQIYAPPNNEVTTRYSAVVVTALSGDNGQPAQVTIIDDGADGDDDDTVSALLVRGESLVRYIKDGAVNDDYQGKWDGDYMRVESSQPVAVMLVTDSDWQHDWAPADNGTLRGTSFYIWANRTSSSARDINAFAYEPGTRLSLYDITDNVLTGSGVARVRADRGAPLLQVDMEEGEDLNVRKGLGLDLLQAGRSYQVVATRPVTLMTGALGGITATGGVRDGGGFVPGRDGRVQGSDFYFTIPHDKGRLSEQELRIISYDDGVVAAVAAGRVLDGVVVGGRDAGDGGSGGGARGAAARVGGGVRGAGGADARAAQRERGRVGGVWRAGRRDPCARGGRRGDQAV